MLTFLSSPPVTITRPDDGPSDRQETLEPCATNSSTFWEDTRISLFKAFVQKFRFVPFISACVNRSLPYSLNIYHRKHYFCNLMTCTSIVTVTRKKNCYMHFNNTSHTPNIHNSHLLINTSLSRIIIWLISAVKP